MLSQMGRGVRQLWQFFGVEMLLVLFVVVMATGVITTYIIASVREDVRAVWPYISDTGNYSPERCIFTLTCCTGAAIASLVIFIYYKHVMFLVDERVRSYRRLNRIALSLGFLSTFGLMLVGSFQDETSLKAVHYIGAVMVFVGGASYCCLATAIGRHISIVNNHRLLKTYIRMMICFILFVSIIVEIITIIVAINRLHSDDTNGEHTHNSRFKWAPGDSGYAVHVVSTYVEWLLAILLFGFFLTYIGEFRVIKVETVISMKEHRGYTAINGVE